MKRLLSNRMPRWVAGLVLAAAISCSGCGGPASAEPVNPTKARETLAGVLDGWKNGDTPAQWQNRSPKIVVQDFDWQSGMKLKDYEILGDGEARDANLFCQVRLALYDPAGGEVQKLVSYVVGTDPVLTVFRGMM